MDCGVLFCYQGCFLGNLILEWNDLIWCGEGCVVIEWLYVMNNFLEFIGWLCLVFCESLCVFGINQLLVMIKQVEVFIIDEVFVKGWVELELLECFIGKMVVVVGLGFVGFVVVQQLMCVGYIVVVFECDDWIGGLFCYGIFDFKMEKVQLELCFCQMQEEGMCFCVGVEIGKDIFWFDLCVCYDVVVIVMGLIVLWDFLIFGCDLDGVYFVMEYLVEFNYVVVGDKVFDQIMVEGKYVIVIGGGDIGVDCIGMVY